MNNKKYDLRINSHNKAEPMQYGYHEKIRSLSMSKKPLELVEIVGANGIIYRVNSNETNSESIKRFFRNLERKFNK